MFFSILSVCHLLPKQLTTHCHDYRVYSKKRQGAYLIFRVSDAALIRGRRLFKRLIPQRQNILFIQFNLLHDYFFMAFFTQELENATNLKRELNERASRYTHFELKNITIDENKFTLLA